MAHPPLPGGLEGHPAPAHAPDRPHAPLVLVRPRCTVRVHEAVVTAVLALLEERQDEQTQTTGADTQSPQNRSATDVGRSTLTGLAADTPLL